MGNHGILNVHGCVLSPSGNTEVVLFLFSKFKSTQSIKEVKSNQLLCVRKHTIGPLRYAWYCPSTSKILY